METVNAILKAAYLPVLLTHFLLLLYISFRSRESLFEPFRGQGRQTLFLPGLLFLLALFLRAGMSGRYGLDDLLWEHVRNAETALASLRFTQFVHPAGHSFLVALSFIFGRAVENASRMTILLDSLSVPLLFFAVRLLSRDKAIAFLSAFILAVLPWQVFLSGTGLDITSSLFFCLAALLALLISLEKGTGGPLAVSLLLLAWAANIRTENLLLLPVLLLVWYRRAPAAAARFPAAALIAFLPSLIWLFLAPEKFGTDSSPDGAAASAFLSLGNIAANCREHILPHFFRQNNGYPLLLLPLLALGLAELVLFKQDKKLLYLLPAWLLAWLLVYGGYWNGGQVYRYSTFLHPALAITAALGGNLLLRLLKFQGGPGLAMLAALLLCFSFSPARLLRPEPVVFWPSVREFTQLRQRLAPDHCILLQTLNYGRSDNVRLLLGRERKYINWPAGRGLSDYGCSGIYYLDLRAYIHPLPEDLLVHDLIRERLFTGYDLRQVFAEGPLKVYEVAVKNIPARPPAAPL